MVARRVSAEDYRAILERRCYMCQLRGRTICEKSLLVCLEIADLESRRTERRFYVRPSHLDTVDRRFMTFDNYLVSLDHTQFHEYTRLTPQEFAQLHSRLAHRLEHLSSHRMPVSSHHRLAITLRFLGHGASFVALAHEVRLGRSTAMKIVYECCRAIIDEFWSETFPVPSAADWQRSADQFRSLWRYPRGVGSIDGKHFRCYAPRNSGSANFNYKGYFSIVLLAVVNGGYRILAFDLGGRGRNSDSALFRTSPLKRFLEGAVGQFPYGGDLAGEGHVDYHILADGGFAQATWMQRPFRQCSSPSGKRLRHYFRTIPCVSATSEGIGRCCIICLLELYLQSKWCSDSPTSCSRESGSSPELLIEARHRISACG